MIRRWRRMTELLLGTALGTAPATVVITLVLGIVGAVASTVYTVGYKLMVNGALTHATNRIVLGAAIVAVLFALAWATSIASATEGAQLTDRINLALGLRISRLASTLPTLEHFERSELLAHLENVTQNRRTLAGAARQLIGLFTQALRALVIVVLLATIYLPVLLVPILALAPALSDRIASRVQKRADDALAEDRRLLADLFRAATSAETARELRTYGMTEAIGTQHAALADRIRRRAVRAALLSSALEAIGWAVFAAGLVGAIVILVLRAADGQVNPGQVVMAVSLLRRAQSQISRSSDTAGNLNTAVGAADHLLALEDHGSAIRLSHISELELPERLTDGIRLKGLEFTYPDSSQSVLGPIDLMLPAGTTIAVVGENGAGKTTLVKLLCAMYAPSAGCVSVDGIDLSSVSPERWRQRVSATFQDFQRFELLLSESVGVGDLPAIDDEDTVRGALRRTGASELETALPDGLATRVGSRFTGGRQLSGGQWQRVALARGLMRAAPLLVVLDEPAASLDAPTEHALFERYAQAAKDSAAANGTITLLVSHRFSTVRAADLIIVLDGGHVLEHGSHAELMAAGGRYAELFTLQARSYG